MSGYYVRRQGDDSDYLEHSLWGNVRSGAHKYLAKLPTPGGGFRYIYNQAELLAARAGKAVSNVKRAADNAIGLTARKQFKSIHNRAERFSAKNQGASPRSSLQKQSQVAYNRYKKTLLGRAENAANAARNAIGNAVGEARRRGEGVVGSIKKGAYAVGRAADNAIGLTARKQFKSIHNRGERFSAKNQGASPRSSLQKQGQVAYNRYKNTLLGRAENAFNAARGAVSGAVGGARNAASNAVDKARAKGQSAIDAAVGAGRGAANNVRKTATETLRSTGMNRGERRRTKQNLDRATAERDRLERGIEAARVKNGEFYDPFDKLEIARDRARRRAQAKVNSATTAYNNAHSKGKRRRT